MKIGYPCINRSIGCTANSTFRLANFSEQRIRDTIERNLSCLERILRYNLDQGFFFFRISSDVIPFASHPEIEYDWESRFADSLERLGAFILEHQMRISMHPDQFVLLNALKPEIVGKSIADLSWHCRFLDALGLGPDARVQIHLGGAYGDKDAAVERFIRSCRNLPDFILRRLAVENDDRLFTLDHCMHVHDAVGIPVIFDNFHHECNSSGENLREALQRAASTWGESDGILMTDYSSQEQNARKGKHTEHIDQQDFSAFLQISEGLDFDIMLEIKDKESSAEEALSIARAHGRV